ncbi:MAG: helix-turn-helix transcriptional regulator [Ruminococcus sp.]|nr:helix-turn-helix transcriptional regulator [Ruminococcus sp.]MBO5320911.1 helix-turn-helix transcriptional regulator [Ruminococcus sp.]
MFEERIKELRTSMGLNQIQFGRKLFVTKQCISNWENGNIQPSIDMLIRIAQTFSVSTDYLLGLNDKPTLSAEGLTSEQILHLRAIIDDIRKKTDDQ